MSGALWGGVMVGLWPAALRSATPLGWAVLGETINQRAGLINLGTEGEMLVGAAVAFGVAASTGHAWLGLLAGALAGSLLSCVHALLCLRFDAHPFAAGLSVWMMGFGTSALYGNPFVGQSIDGLGPVPGVLTHLPLLGGLPWTGFLLLLTTAVLSFLMFRSRMGLAMRAAGESVHATRAAGYSVGKLRTLAVMVGGLAAGLGGAALSIDDAQTWAEGMTKGRGLVAVGLVIVARWNPVWALPTALLFGGAEALSLHLQSAGVVASPHLLQMLPYVTSLLVFVASCVRQRKSPWAPAALSAVLDP